MIIIANKYRIIRCIAGGTFGDIYLGKCLRSGEEVAIKVESTNAKFQQLLYEASLYRVLSGAPGFPRYYEFATTLSYNALVVQLLGPSLEDLFNYCRRKFTTKTILMLAEQMISRLKFLHSKGIIHRDIKPENFVIGSGAFCKQVFLVDFGLAKKFFCYKSGTHIPFCSNKKLLGTVRYASLNAHRGIELSRRDDMESLGYLFVYFNSGSLPWQGIKAANKTQKYEKIAEIKESITIRELCRQLPSEFYKYFCHCRELAFDAKPNYNLLQSLFNSLFLKEHQYDFVYDWTILNATVKRDDTDMRNIRQNHNYSLNESKKINRRRDMFGVSLNW